MVGFGGKGNLGCPYEAVAFWFDPSLLVEWF